MAPSGFGPYHGMWLEDTQTMCIGVIPELKQALMSVKQLADQGYTTIFHPHLEGVTVRLASIAVGDHWSF